MTNPNFGPVQIADQYSEQLFLAKSLTQHASNVSDSASCAYELARRHQDELKTAETGLFAAILEQIHRSAGPETNPVDYLLAIARIASVGTGVEISYGNDLQNLHDKLQAEADPIVIIGSDGSDLAFGRNRKGIGIAVTPNEETNNDGVRDFKLELSLDRLHRFGISGNRHDVYGKEPPIDYIGRFDEEPIRVGVVQNVVNLRIFQSPKSLQDLLLATNQATVSNEPLTYKERSMWSKYGLMPMIAYGYDGVTEILRRLTRLDRSRDSIRNLAIGDVLATGLNIGIGPEDIISNRSKIRKEIVVSLRRGVAKLIADEIREQLVSPDINSGGTRLITPTQSPRVVNYISGEGAVIDITRKRLGATGSKLPASLYSSISETLLNIYGISVDPSLLAA